MFERRHEPLVSKSRFLTRLMYSMFMGFLFLVIALGMGVWGYHFFEGMSWVDAFVNAAMILSGMGPLNPLNTTGGKIFAGLYALFSGLTFILIIGIIFAPIFHRFFHKFHLDSTGK